MPRITLTGSDAELSASLARGPAYMGRYMSRLIAQRKAEDAAGLTEREAADAADKRARNAARMRKSRAAAKVRRDAIRYRPSVPPANTRRWS
jgi:hypothetical protein